MARKETDAERATRLHNEGQSDAARSDYDPPHHWLWNTTVGSDRDIEDNEHYNAGYQHTKSQG